MTDKKYKIDIFKVLERLSCKDATFYQSLSEDEAKTLAPLVLMRWMSGTNDARQIYFLNELVNPMVFSLAKHKSLLFDLLTICGPGKPRRYFWNKAKSKKTTLAPISVEIIKQYYNYSTIRALEVLPLLTESDIIEYAIFIGVQPDKMKLISKEWKDTPYNEQTNEL